MKNFQSMLNCLHGLHDNDLVVPSAQRIEFKRTKTGSWRLFVAPASNFKQSSMGPVLQLLEGKGVTCNAFAKGGLVTGMTFVDDNEDNEEASGQ